MKRYIKKIPDIVYALIFFTFIGMTVFLAVGSDILPPRGNIKTTELVWFHEDGTVIDNPAKLNKLPEVSTDKECSIFTVIPDNIPKGGELRFRSKHLFLSAFLDGEPVYIPYTPESRLYTNSMGVNWVMIPLGTDDAGKTLEIRFRVSYKDSECGISMVNIAAGHEQIMDILRDKAVAFINSLIFIILSLMLMIADIPISRAMNKSHAFLYLGLITFSIALYSITETKFLQLFFVNERIVHYLTCCSLMLGPMPVILYANSIMPLKFNGTKYIFAGANLALFITLVILNFTGLRDYHDTLFLVHIDIIASFIIMAYTIIRHISAKMKENKRLDAYTFLEIAGLSALMISGVIDVLRYYFVGFGDPAKYLRIGILIFVIMFAASSCEKLTAALVMNAKNELIAKLAYEDGLTGLYNRTAYNETLEKLPKTQKYIGICGFDVNNLKKINDNIGHDMGDRLIKESGNIIKTAFDDSKCICFRIGGDEFTAIVYGDNVSERISTALEKLYAMCDEFNAVGNYPFKISIASGSSVYDGTESIEEVAKKADKLMYEHKRIMKEKMSMS